ATALFRVGGLRVVRIRQPRFVGSMGISVGDVPLSARGVNPSFFTPKSRERPLSLFGGVEISRVRRPSNVDLSPPMSRHLDLSPPFEFHSAGPTPSVWYGFVHNHL